MADQQTQHAGQTATTENDTTSASSDIRMYTTTWCGDCRRAKRVFSTLGVPYTEIDIERHPEAAEFVRHVNRGAQSVPTIIFPDGSKLVEPANMVLEAKLREYQG